MIELRRLQAFVVTVEEGHITRAAERLGMQQPPLSRLLQGLEVQLGYRLLTRRPRGVEPTEAGQALLEEARAVLLRAAAVEDAVRRAARGEAGRLAVGFTSSAALQSGQEKRVWSRLSREDPLRHCQLGGLQGARHRAAVWH